VPDASNLASEKLVALNRKGAAERPSRPRRPLPVPATLLSRVASSRKAQRRPVTETQKGN
jgi:hypothetical protein